MNYKKVSLALLLSLGLVGFSACESPATNQATTTEMEGEQTTAESAKEVVSIPDFTTVDLAGEEVTKELLKEHKLTMLNVFSVG